MNRVATIRCRNDQSVQSQAAVRLGTLHSALTTYWSNHIGAVVGKTSLRGALGSCSERHQNSNCSPIVA